MKLRSLDQDFSTIKTNFLTMSSQIEAPRLNFKQLKTLFAYHLGPVCIPTVLCIPQVGNHCSTCNKAKDAGFVYKSFQNKTNRVIWDFCFHETNPQNKSFKNKSTKRIHETNPQNESFKKGLQNQSMKQIF